MQWPSHRFPVCLVVFITLGFCSCSLFAEGQKIPSNLPIEQAINQAIHARYVSENITPAPRVDDAMFLRRVTLDLAGRIPTVPETTAYIGNNNPNKKVELIDRLLASQDFIFHQRNELDILLLASVKNDNNFRSYLLWAVENNRPWDAMFRDMMLGSNNPKPEKDSMQEKLGFAQEFLKVRVNELDDMTNDTSKLFFGVAINCAKCHDHPLVDDWKQDHYFGMASFFHRTYKTKSNLLAEKHSGQLEYSLTSGEKKKAKFMFLTGTILKEQGEEKTKEQLKKEEEEVKKQMKDNKAPPPTPPKWSPRAEFVKVALQKENQQLFAKAMVNRTWERFFGLALIDPPDQLHANNDASHPELMDWLATDFRSHKFDLKRLIRGIVLSEAYARSSQWDEKTSSPEPSLFAVAKPRILSPYQYATALLIASSSPARYPVEMKVEDWNKERESLENSANSISRQFELPGVNFQVSVDEALLFSNSSRIENDFLRDSSDKLVGHLKQLETPREIIEAAFLSILTRKPEQEELDAFEQYLQERHERKVEGIKQIVWALLTSPEMRFNY